MTDRGPIVMLSERDPLVDVGGGGAAYVRAHARAAIALGYEPHLFAVSSRDGLTQAEFGVVHHVGMPFRRWKTVTEPEFRDVQIPWHMPVLKRALASYLRHTPDVSLAHAFGFTGCVAIDLSREMAREGRPLVPLVSSYTTRVDEAKARVRTAWGYSLGRRLQHRATDAWIKAVVDRIERRGYAGARLLTVNYEAVRRLLLESFGDDLPEIRRIPYTSERAFLPSSDKPPPPVEIAALKQSDAPLLVSVSRQDARKGVDIFIHALAILKASGTDFTACLVGPGPLKKVHRRLITELGLNDVVALPGFVPDPMAYLHHADIYVLPSLEEASGSVALIEAMQAGLPPVVSAIDGLLEDVQDGENGLLVAAGDVEALARTLQRLIDDLELRRRLGQAARQTFDARFSPRGLIDALDGVYSEVLFSPG